MKKERNQFPQQPSPKPDKTFRKTVWLQIYLPLIFIILLLGTLVSVLWIEGVGTSSGWADAALVILIIPALLVGLIIFGVVAVLCYGIFYVIAWIPGPSKRGREITARVATETKRFANLAARPFMAPRAAVTAIVETIRYLLSIFSKEG